MTNSRCCFKVIIVVLLAGLWSCTSPEVRFSLLAEKYHFEKKIVRGTTFNHVIYVKKSARNNATLHIYLDGDGLTWISHRWISSNPTPRNTLMLRLMQQDENTSLYIGRPCYFGFSQSTACTAKLWTSHRYSSAVINTMLTVIQNMLKLYQPKRIILIGYSGGGTLAMLLAEHIPNMTGIITIAANLDIDQWVDYHGYSPLTGSLNPAQQIPLTKNIFQLHLAGGKDNNVPIQQIQSFTKKQYLAQLRIFDDYDHHCCWEEIWPSILKSIDIDE